MSRVDRTHPENDLRNVVPRETAIRADHEVAAAHRHLRQLIGHDGDYGALLEGVIREAIAPRLKAGFAVGSGYIRTLNTSTPQTDVLIYDRREQAELLTQGHISLVHEASAIVAGEVKSTFRGGQGRAAILHLAEHKRLCQRISTFAIGIEGWKTPHRFATALARIVHEHRDELFTLDRQWFRAPDLVVNGACAVAVKETIVAPDGTNRWAYTILSPPDELNRSGAGALVAYIQDYCNGWLSARESAHSGPGIRHHHLTRRWIEREFWAKRLNMTHISTIEFCKIPGRGPIEFVCDATFVENGRVNIVFPHPLAPDFVPYVRFYVRPDDADDDAPPPALIVQPHFISQSEFIGRLVSPDGTPCLEPTILYWQTAGGVGGTKTRTLPRLKLATKLSPITVDPWLSEGEMPELCPNPAIGEHVSIETEGFVASGVLDAVDHGGLQLATATIECKRQHRKFRKGDIQVHDSPVHFGWRGRPRVRYNGVTYQRDDFFEW